MGDTTATFEPRSVGATDFDCVVAEDRPGVTRVTLIGELDLAAAPGLDGVLSRASEAAELVIIDLSKLTFMDSSGLQTIVAASARLRDANRELALVPGPRQVQQLLELTGVVNKLRFTDGNGAQAAPDPAGVQEVDAPAISE